MAVPNWGQPLAVAMLPQMRCLLAFASEVKDFSRLPQPSGAE
jgi:hypothetical protein